MKKTYKRTKINTHGKTKSFIDKSKYKKLFFKIPNIKKRKLNKIKKIKNIYINNTKYKLFINILTLFIFSISYYLYYLSLEKCFDGEDICCQYVKWIKIKVIELISSSVISAILFEFIFFKKMSKFHILHFILVLINFYYYSNGVYFHDHGYYNFYIFVTLLIIIIIGTFIIIKLFNFIKKHYIIFIIFLSLLLSLIFYHYLKYDPVNCNDWGKGLNNTFIDNDKDKYSCQIKIPNKCPYKIGKYFQDMTKIRGIKCINVKPNARKEFLKHSKSNYINKNTVRIGFPLTNKDPYCLKDRFDESILKHYFFRNIFDMDNITDNIPYQPEIIADFSKNPSGELLINLIFNKTLSDERKILEKNVKPYSENIMILFIDSVSRGNSIRQLKKTLNFFEKFMSYKGGYNKNYPGEKFHSFQFFKYHSFIGCTHENYPQIFYGKSRKHTKLVLITKYLKENGYITGYACDICRKDGTRTLHDFTYEEIHDHQMALCDPNKIHANQFTVKCLYGKNQGAYLYEYGNQFWRKYKDNRKFLTIITNDGHEGSLESLKYIDGIIYNHLNSLYNDNLLKDSSIFLLSDHGVGMPSIYSLYEFYSIEQRLPMLYIIINDRKNISYNDQYFYIQKNQQTLITSYDIYNTIGNLLYGDNYVSIKNKTSKEDTAKTEHGQSLFTEINQKMRNPRNYKNMYKKVCI